MANASKWCPYCGEDLPREAVRCSRCGRWLDGRSQDAERSGASESVSSTQKSAKGAAGGSRPSLPRRRKRVWLALMLVGVVIATAAALIRLQGAGETTAAPPTLTSTPGTTITPVPSSSPSPFPSPTPLPAGLARQTVQQYWDLISKGNVSQAYDLLSTSAKSSTPREQFIRNITHLLDVTNGLTVTAGLAIVLGSTAQVPVTLDFTNSGPTRANQRLVWEGSWRIDEAGAGVAPQP